jgi:predicted dinucleotide-utilizing enzyme
MKTTLLRPRPVELPAAASLEVVRVGLAGCGVVGGDLARLLHADPRRFDVVSVLVRDVTKPRVTPIATTRFTSDVERFLAHRPDVVVEAIGGISPAREIAAATLAPRWLHSPIATEAVSISKPRSAAAFRSCVRSARRCAAHRCAAYAPFSMAPRTTC